MSGRLEQLARQIRRLRTSASEPARTLQRAVHLALDLAHEQADGDFGALAAKGILDPAVAERLGALAGVQLSARDFNPDVLVDLDVFLRSIELGAPAARLPLPPLSGSPKLPPGTQRASVNVSGRVITLVGRDGRAFVLVDDRPVGQPFDLVSVPMTPSELTRAPDGTVRIEWPGELRLVVGAGFTSVRLEHL